MTDVKTTGASDTKAIAGGNPSDNLQIVSCDQVTVTGDGSVDRPLRAPGVPGGVLTDDLTLIGDGSFGDELRLKKVFTDDTLTGKGTQAEPLSVVGANSIEVVALVAASTVAIDPDVATSILTGSPGASCVAALPAGANGFQKTIIVVGIQTGTDVSLTTAGGLTYGLNPKGGVANPATPGAITLRYSTILGAWLQVDASSNWFAADPVEAVHGTQVATDAGRTIDGSGTPDDPLREAVNANTYTDDNDDIDPTLDTVFVQWDDDENTMSLALADGDIDGMPMHISTDAISIGVIQITVTTAGGTFVIQFADSSLPSGAVLTWNADLERWNIVSLLNATIS